jgi:hypothetical protein
MANKPVCKRTRGKKLLFSLGALGIGLILLEGLSWCVVKSVESQYGMATRAVQEVIVHSGELRSSDAESIHPYLGWVSNPQLNGGTTLFDRKMPVNSLGFDDEEHGILKRKPGRFVVGITGGSVAWQTSVAGENTLRQELQEHPQLKGQQIEFVRLALSGYKQPQQLMALNYMLTLGNEFDVIVNVDGYNEIALGVCENYRAGVFAAYPRSWHARMQNVVDPRNHATAFRLLQARGQRQEFARNRLESPLHWSSTLNLVWWVRNKSLENDLLRLATEIRKQKNTFGFGFAAAGPKQIYSDEDGLYAHLVDIWSNGSLQMHHLCRANKCHYVHILQPNQYLPNSKPMEAEERKLMLQEDQQYGHAIAKGYPMLIKQGEALKQQDVDFHDLTQLFAQISEPIYADRFCHYNEAGNILLARAVAKQVLAKLDSEKMQ